MVDRSLFCATVCELKQTQGEQKMSNHEQTITPEQLAIPYVRNYASEILEWIYRGRNDYQEEKRCFYAGEEYVGFKLPDGLSDDVDNLKLIEDLRLIEEKYNLAQFEELRCKLTGACTFARDSINFYHAMMILFDYDKDKELLDHSLCQYIDTDARMWGRTYDVLRNHDYVNTFEPHLEAVLARHWYLCGVATTEQYMSYRTRFTKYFLSEKRNKVNGKRSPRVVKMRFKDPEMFLDMAYLDSLSQN